MKLVRVLWLDAKVSVDGDIPTLPIMESVGYLYERTKTRTVVVSLLGTNSDPRIITSIPSCLVKKIVVIKK